MIELYRKVNDDVQCLLCPNLCILKDAKFGICKTRKRENDKIVNHYSGIISSSGLDPIEKKPLYHFMPATQIFSVGFYGCTLNCQFCQNYSISQYHPENTPDRLSPEDMVYILKEKNLKSIAFTYSEPTLYFEWVRETAILCRDSNIKTVLVTNGYLNEKPAEELLKYIDAANIDLKSFRENFYKKVCHGKLEPVKDFIRLAYDMKVHIELTTLVVTDTNDTIEEMGEIVDFIKNISKDIPFHISRYHPSYKFDKPATSIEKLEKLIALAKNNLNFVYGGNIPGDADTYCKNCKTLLVSRNYYSVKIHQVDKNGKCKNCGEFNNIYFFNK
jgi:pyruvate formate lyase activating enzyme